MLRALSIAALFVASPALAATDPDPWFGRDKALHFGASALIGATGYAVGSAVWPLPESSGFAGLMLGGWASLAAGVGKEVLDLAGVCGAQWSWRDVAWNALGTVAGLAVAWAVAQGVRLVQGLALAGWAR